MIIPNKAMLNAAVSEGNIKVSIVVRNLHYIKFTSMSACFDACVVGRAGLRCSYALDALIFAGSTTDKYFHCIQTIKKFDNTSIIHNISILSFFNTTILCAS
jgi:hypothetical protein